MVLFWPYGKREDLIFERGQSFKNFAGDGTVGDRFILADFAVPEDQHALRELRDVVFVGH
jgi:hypothetical protein